MQVLLIHVFLDLPTNIVLNDNSGLRLKVDWSE